MPKSVKGVMKEWKAGQLHSGSSKGPVVKSQRQAVAIALSEQRKRKGAQLSRKATVHTGGLPHPHRNLGGYLHPRKQGR